MEEIINQVFLLTPSEIQVIAAGKDIHGMFGMQDKPLQVDEAMVFQAMNRLYQQQFIQNTIQGRFVLNENLEKIMTTISQAHTIILIRSFTQEAKSKIIYIGDRLIATEPSRVDVDAIRIYEIPVKELRNFLEDDIKGIEKQYTQVLDEEHLIQAAMERSFILQREDVDSLSNAIVMIEKMNQKKGKIDTRLLIKQEKNKKQLLYYKQEEQRISMIKEDVSVDWIIGMIEEAFYDND